MSLHSRISVVTAVLLTAAAALTAGPVAAKAPAWNGPNAIPGTAGQVNPLASTAPNGADLVLWGVGGSTSPQNSVKAKLRQPGSDHWVHLPSPMVDKDYGQPVAIAETRAGDFWVTFEWYNASDVSEVYIARLDSSTGRWTRTTRVFHDAAYGHASSTIAVSDRGEVFVAAAAVPHTFSNPPRYRTEVATLRPGSAWRTKFLTPANRNSGASNIVANPKGQAAVSFIQGSTLSQMRVRAATRGAGPSARWKVANLSVAGDSQRSYPAIGANGRVAVEWSAPSTGAATVRLATAKIGTGDPWAIKDAVTGGAGSNNATFPVVSPDGSVTALWETFVNPNSLLYARQLSGGVWGTANPYSTVGQRAVLDSAQLRPNGTVGVLYQQFSAGLANEGLRYQVLEDGVPAGEVVLTNAGNGSASSPFLGVDAAYGNHVLWTRGDYPDTDFATMSESSGRPEAATALHSGVIATKATVKGKMRVGHRVLCQTGYWVEATDVSYRWFRNGSAIRHATGHKYLLVSADRGRKLSCQTKAVSDFGQHVLKSRDRRVH